MPFAAELRESLRGRDEQFPSEFTRGHSLEHVLDRYLLAIEQMGIGDLLTSVLLLDGIRLSHGAAPSLPRSYREAIDGSEIGPHAGSCGTAAYLGQPVYVTDIATDPLWDDYRHLALAHGLKSCWSTPIRDEAGAVIGTFAIYHREIGAPTPDEVEAIQVITGHVAQAITQARPFDGETIPFPTPASFQERAAQKDEHSRRLQLSLDRLETLAAELEAHAERAETTESKAMLKAAAADSLKLVATLRDHTEPDRHPN